MTAIALLGTGLLGGGMVENLLAKGHAVRIWNRSRAKLAPLVAQGAVAGETPADTVKGCERVHLVLAEDEAVDTVIAALRPGLGKDVPVLDHSTNLPARVAERSKRLAAEGIQYLHAPVFMSPQNARDASGLMLIAGPKAKVEPLIAPLGVMTGKVWHCSERVEVAACHKLAGNGVLMALAGVMGDVFAMGRAAGLDATEALSLFDVFKAGSALSFIGQRVAKADHSSPSFELRMARKDVRLMLQSTDGAQDLTVIPALAAAMDRAIEAGRGGDDYAAFAMPR